MKEEPADVKVESEEKIPDDVKEIKEEGSLEDAKDLEFLFESIECLAALKNQAKNPRGDAEKLIIDPQVAEGWLLLEGTSYLSDAEYNVTSSSHGPMRGQEEDHHPMNVNAEAEIPFRNNGLDNLHPSSEGIIQKELANTRKCPEKQGFTCPVCGKVSRTSLQLMEHKKSHETNGRCNKCFSTKMALERHTDHHICSELKEPNLSGSPAKGDEDILPSDVNSLETKYPNKNSTQKFKRKEHTQNDRLSEYSKTCRKESQELILHEIEECTTKHVAKCICNVCNKSEREKKVDLCTDTEEMLFHCNICGKQCRWSNELKQHQCVNSGEKRFKCRKCGRTFAERDLLKRHFRTHKDEKPFKCNVCAKEFDEEPNLNGHLCIHSNEKPYICSFCEKAFKQKTYLKVHIRIHTGEKPYKCNMCNKGFTQKGSLNTHMRIHSTERPFVCSFCGRRFRHKCSLKSHIHIHSGEEPFKCNVCGKEFSKEKTLNDHIHTHNVQRS